MTVRSEEPCLAGGVEVVCPSCLGGVERSEDALECRACRRRYPVLGGVPDLRLEPDRFLSLEEDRAKALAVLEKAGGRGFGAALDAYWSLTPELDPKLAWKHRHRQLCEREAGAGLLQEVVRRLGAAEGPILDAGCGLGGFVAAAAAAGLAAVGVDAALRWAVVAKLLLVEAGADAPILCANAERLPFRAKAFDLAVANDLIEHLADPAAGVAGVARAARKAYIASTHRYSLAQEPHVRLWGVGWLPRERQSAYVQKRRGHPYDKVRPVMGPELRELVRGAGLDPSDWFAAPVFAGHLGLRARVALSALERVRWGAPRVGVVGR